VRILVYVDPHPIRNDHEQFTHAGRLFAGALLKASRRKDVDFKVFANERVADQLVAEMPSLEARLCRPTSAEAASIQEFDRTWDEPAIRVWLGLVEGTNAAAALYASILRRIHQSFPFDIVLLWAENGAVRIAAKELGAATLHGELGPTRAPFPRTIYLDGRGTNGNASVRSVPREVLDRVRVVHNATWLTRSSRKQSGSPALIESGVLWPTDATAALIPSRPYVFVPLQLADDLNTLSHSTFGSPLDFLETVIPAYRDQGLDIVLKSHPGVIDRPYNIVEEARAVKRFRGMPGVTILPRDVSVSDSLAIVTQAEAVCSVNSSLGFEAMLLGKVCTLLGSAAFDLHDCIRQRGLQLTSNDEQRAWDTQVVSFMMGHYLLPIEDVESGDALIGAIRLVHAEYRRRGEFGKAFWEEWVETMAFGHLDLLQLQKPPRSEKHELAALADGLANMVDGEVTPVDGGLRLQLLLPGRAMSFVVHSVMACFCGHIDELSEEAGIWRVRGWAFDLVRNAPPVFLLIADETHVIACVPLTSERADVAAHLEKDSAAHCGFEAAFPATNANLRMLFVSAEQEVQEAAWRAGPLL
jgi:hypothetical protein